VACHRESSISKGGRGGCNNFKFHIICCNLKKGGGFIKTKHEKIFAIFSLIFFVVISGCGSSENTDGLSSSDRSASSNLTNSLTLRWDAPTTNADGTPLSDLAGYKIYYGTSSGNYTKVIDIGNVTTYKITELSSGQWCFAITAYDFSGNESSYSNEACTEI